jgi:hypothetical protein
LRRPAQLERQIVRVLPALLRILGQARADHAIERGRNERRRVRPSRAARPS